MGKSGPQTFLERSAIFGSLEVGKMPISMFWHAASPKTAFSSAFDPIFFRTRRLSSNLKKTRQTRISPFLATRWGDNHSKTPFSDSQRQITPI